MKQKLLTKKDREKLPPLYSQDGKGDDAIVYVKFFSPYSNWTWYATEGQPVLDEKGNEVDFTFFGLVEGFESELGYFSLNELASAKGMGGRLPLVERDMYFNPIKLGDVRKNR